MAISVAISADSLVDMSLVCPVVYTVVFISYLNRHIGG
jgi:hypothetical protein